MARDPYRYFRAEARELIDAIGAGVLALEREADPTITARLLRAAHTLKGAARVVKQTAIAEAAHAVEELLEPLRVGTASAPRASIERLLGLIDSMNAQLLALEPQAAPVVTVERAPAPERVLRSDPGEVDVLLTGLAEMRVELRGAEGSIAELTRAKQLSDLLAEQLATSGGQRLRSLAEELRGTLARLERELPRRIEFVEREANQAREVAERLRLTPVGSIFPLLERTARDAAAVLGKQVTFTAAASDARLDTASLGVVRDALVQLVKNAVAHGIASSGAIVVSVVRRGKRLVFACHDDGRGLDLEAIARAAQRKGLLPANARLTPTDALGLLLRGGLSTASTVNELAGRGVGLNVVHEAAEQLGGSVRIGAEGTGTTIELDVPASTSSFEVLLLEVNGSTVSVPLDAVRATLRVTAEEIVHTPQGDALAHRGRLVPFALLGRLLAPGPVARWLPHRLSIVILGDESAGLALGVERLAGTASVLVLQLPELAPTSRLVAGASLDADGTPQIMLDPDSLIAAARADQAGATTPPTVRRLPILVIDDSLTTRMLEQSILESAGYEVDLANSAEEGIVKAGQRRYGVILVDVEMPGIDGFTFVERTRQDPVLREVPAILVTSRDAPEDRRRGEEAGAAAYVVKGEFDQGFLLDTIAHLLRGHA